MADILRPDSHQHPWAAVPRVARPLVRHALVTAADVIIDALRAEVAEYALPLEGEFGRRIQQGVTVALSQFVDLLGSDTEPPNTGIYFDLGRLEHRAGRTLDALQTAYRVGSRVAWRRIAAADDARRLAPGTIYQLAEALFAYIEQLAGASVAGYAYEQSARAGSRQAGLHRLIEHLARQPAADPGELGRLAADAEWPLPARLAALVVGEGDPMTLARRMPVGAIGTVLDRDGVVILPDPDAPGRLMGIARALRGQPAVLGPTVPWQRAHRSITRARAAWPLHAAGELGADSLVRADDHLLALLLGADPELTADLIWRRLAPIRAMSPASRERAVTTLRAWLDAHGDVTRTADTLGVHQQTVRYRLSRLRDAFAGALDDPTARLELDLALRAAGDAVDQPR